MSDVPAPPLIPLNPLASAPMPRPQPPLQDAVPTVASPLLIRLRLSVCNENVTALLTVIVTPSTSVPSPDGSAAAPAVVPQPVLSMAPQPVVAASPWVCIELAAEPAPAMQLAAEPESPPLQLTAEAMSRPPQPSAEAAPSPLSVQTLSQPPQPPAQALPGPSGPPAVPRPHRKASRLSTH